MPRFRLVVAAAILAGAATLTAAPNYNPHCSTMTREYAGRVYRITNYQFHQPTWCDECGVRYVFEPYTGSWVPADQRLRMAQSSSQMEPKKVRYRVAD